MRKRLTFVNKERTPSPDSDDAKKKPAIVTGGIKKKINTANLFGGDRSSSSDSDKKKKPSPTRQPQKGKLKIPTFEEEKKEKPRKTVGITVSKDSGNGGDDFKARLAGMLAKGPRAPAASAMVSR